MKKLAKTVLLILMIIVLSAIGKWVQDGERIAQASEQGKAHTRGTRSSVGADVMWLNETTQRPTHFGMAHAIKYWRHAQALPHKT